jgi:hypothetical protein
MEIRKRHCEKDTTSGTMNVVSIAALYFRCYENRE